MSRFARLARKSSRSGGGRGEIAIVIAVGICLAVVGVIGVDDYASVSRRAADAAAATANDDELYTGSILYMPHTGNVCRQLLFDNLNGRISDNGYVDCERAAYHGADNGPKQWSVARAKVISTGFRRR